MLPRVARYAELLAGAGIERGLLGPSELDRLWDRHLVNSAALAPLLPRRGHVADLGSGAGLPGVVLALLRDDVTFRLVEPLARRVAFLAEVIDDLGLGNVEVVRARAEEPAARVRGGYDVVVARAVAALGRLVTLAAPLVRPGGQILALKGAKAAAEIAAASGELRRVRGRADVVVRSLPDGTRTATVVRVVVGGTGQSRPRRRTPAPPAHRTPSSDPSPARHR